ncbi:MAG TPA: helix-turn-helix domain-containing protein, partial [Vicinamibacterales bacterium]|nr:helix-turn-helix domain-containing protein [Vicinamibacterales bacterium]
AIERVIIMTPGDVVAAADLPESVRAEAPASALTEDRGERPGTLREFKESAERAFLLEKLRENDWNISKTAETIGTPRSNLYKKLEQYNIRQDMEP